MARSHSLWKPQFGVEASLPQPFWGQALLALETALVLFKLQNRAYGQLRPGLGGDSLEQGLAGTALP